MKNYRKIIAAVLVVAIVASCAVGATLAWLQDTTNTVTNTFSPSTIDIELKETVDPNFNMVPGTEYEKDPKATVKANSEACWLFVEVTENGGVVTLADGTTTKWDDFLTYTVDEAKWKPVAGYAGVYFREVGEEAADQSWTILTGNKVKVNNEVTKEMMDALKVAPAQKPTLSFTAYAIQSENIADEVTAWKTIKNIH